MHVSHVSRAMLVTGKGKTKATHESGGLFANKHFVFEEWEVLGRIHWIILQKSNLIFQ